MAGWTIASEQFTREHSEMSVGAYNGIIYLVGDWGWPNQVTKYNPVSNTLTTSYNALSTAISGGFGSQHWTQQGSILYIIQCCQGFNVPSNPPLSIYDMATEQLTANWRGITTPEYIGDSACLSSTPQHLYVVGSGDGMMASEASTALQILSLSTYQWETIPPPMIEERGGLSCIVANQYLWVFGGFTNSMLYDSNERIPIVNIAQNVWQYADRLSMALRDTRAILWGDDIYIIGGTSDVGGSGMGQTDIVHIMNAISATISLSPDRVPFRNAGTAPVIVDSILYAFGGMHQTGETYLTVEWAYYTLPSGSISTSSDPSTFPSDIPTGVPSNIPTDVPSNIPTDFPSNIPTDVPSNIPTDFPSNIPTDFPSIGPSVSPSYATIAPSDATRAPSVNPSNVPSVSPVASYLWINNIDNVREYSSTTNPVVTSTNIMIGTTAAAFRSPRVIPLDDISIIFIAISVVCLVLMTGVALWWLQTMKQQKHALKLNRMMNGDEEMNGAEDGDGNANVNQECDAQALNEWFTDAVLLPQYFDVFLENGFGSLPIVKAITRAEQLREMGIREKAHLILLMHHIEELQNSEGRQKRTVGTDITAEGGEENPHYDRADMGALAVRQRNAISVSTEAATNTGVGANAKQSNNTTTGTCTDGTGSQVGDV